MTTSCANQKADHNFTRLSDDKQTTIYIQPGRVQPATLLPFCTGLKQVLKDI